MSIVSKSCGALLSTGKGACDEYTQFKNAANLKRRQKNLNQPQIHNNQNKNNNNNIYVHNYPNRLAIDTII